MTGSALITISFIAYLVFIFTIGIITSKMNKSLKDFLLGGRKMGPWLLSISERASGESSWLIIGLTGTALMVGLSAVWIALGCFLGILFNWFFIAKKLRRMGGEYDALTIPDYISSRYGDKGHILRITSSLIIMIFYLLYVSAQFMGAGTALNVTFGMPVFWGMVLGAVIIIFYTTLGGFSAVVWTDFFQGLIMIAGLVILPLVAISRLGGISEVIAALEVSSPEKLALFGNTEGGWKAFLLVLSGLGWGLGYMGQPHLLVRFLAFDDVKNVKKGSIIAGIWSLFAFGGAVLIGIVGASALKGSLEGGTLFGSVIEHREEIFPLMTIQMLPGLLAGIVISGAIAAMMSTADSQLLVCTSTITEDFMNKMKKKAPEKEKLVLVGRISTLILGVFSFIFAIIAKDVFNQVLHAWAGLGASIGSVILISLYWKRSTGKGALWGMITGFLTVVIWNAIPFLKKSVFDNEIIPAFILAVTVNIMVSLFSKGKGGENEL